MRFLWLGTVLFLQTTLASAAVTGENVEYRQAEAALEGYVAYDDATEDKRPVVLVVHEWKGLGEYAKRRSRELAALGYLAFAADIYGKGVRPQTHEEAGKTAGTYKNDRSLMRARIQAAMDVAQSHPLAEPSKIAAIGYCFGGTTVLELARSGADVRGVVSFHGALSTPEPAAVGTVKAKVLVEHGAADKFISPEEIEAFKKEMADARVDMRFEAHEGAVHSFTVQEAGNDPSAGMAYDEAADKRSWESMKDFLQEIFA